MLALKSLHPKSVKEASRSGFEGHDSLEGDTCPDKISIHGLGTVEYCLVVLENPWDVPAVLEMAMGQEHCFHIPEFLTIAKVLAPG